MDRIVQHAMEVLAQELQSIRPSDFDLRTISSLESRMKLHLEPFLPFPSQLDLHCCFVTSNLMVIDVTQKPNLHLNVSGVLH